MTARPNIRIMSGRNINKFKDNIKTIVQNFKLDPSKNCERHWNTFIMCITNAYQNYFPPVKISATKNKSKEWMTNALKKSSITKEKLYKIWIQNKTPINETKYKTYKNIYNKAIKTAKHNYYL